MRVKNILAFIIIITLLLGQLTYSSASNDTLESGKIQQIYDFAISKTIQLERFFKQSLYIEKMNSYNYIGNDIKEHIQDLSYGEPVKVIILWPTDKYNTEYIMENIGTKEIEGFADVDYLPTIIFYTFILANMADRDIRSAEFFEWASLYDSLTVEGFEGAAYVILCYGQGKPQVATAFYEQHGMILTKTSLIYFNTIDKNEELLVTLVNSLFGSEAFETVTIDT